MDLKKVFDSFSARAQKVTKPAKGFNYDVPMTLRNKVFLICKDIFDGSGRFGEPDYSIPFWVAIHKILQMRKGAIELSRAAGIVIQDPDRRRVDDALRFLSNCANDDFLSFIEDIFKVDEIWQAHLSPNDIVAMINQVFQSENVGYDLTELITETVEEMATDPMFRGRVAYRTRTIAVPQVIRKDNQLVHNEAITPALHLLGDPRFSEANKEFLEALEDYKKNDFDDCLVKCGSAFESVMKVICAAKKWPYKENDTAAPLLKTILEKTSLDSFFNDPLLIIATIRNKLSKAHGAGTKPKVVSAQVARYAINSTAAAILLLIEESRI